MLRLRKILLCDNLYRVTVVLVFLTALLVTLLPKYESKLDKEKNNFTCKVLEYQVDGNKLKMTLDCGEKVAGNYYFKTKEDKSFYLDNIKIGGSLNIIGELETPKKNTVPFLFNYKKYLYNQKIYYLLNIQDIKLLDNEISLFYKIKNLAYSHANNYDHNEYIYAYILGKTYNIDKEVIKSYRTNGISHLFALSGLHVSVFSMIIMWVLKKIKISELTRYILIFIFLLLFSFITGFSPSILRASLLFILLGINKVFNFYIKTENILYLVFIILVIINPFIIYNMSFILSFTTTYFLIISSEFVNDKKYLMGLLKVGVISFLANIGLSIYYFNYINPLSVVMNLIFVPFVTFIVFPFTIVTYIFPFLAFILNILTFIMENLSLVLSNVSFTIYFPNISVLEAFLYYIILVTLIKSRKKYFLILLCVVLLVWKIKPYFNNNTEIYFIDVGQGDSALIVTPRRKKAILIDTGGKITYEMEEWKRTKSTYSIAENTLIPLMRKLGISKLEYLILSHGDFDHMGEAINLVNNFKVEKVIFNNDKYNNLELKLINVLEEKNIPYYQNIKELNLDDNKLYFLNHELYDNENDNSNVIYTELDGAKLLLTGDAGIEVEQDIINKYNLNNIDILKVGHHGSKTSSSEEFIDSIEPKYSIISVGKNNRYGHPNDGVLETLEDSKIYRTDLDGSVMFKIKNNELEIETCTP